jgi:hypothetical protein
MPERVHGRPSGQGSEEGTHIGKEPLWLFQRCKVTTGRHVGPVNDAC